VDAARLELHRRDRRGRAADKGQDLAVGGAELLGDPLDPLGDVDDVGVAGGRDGELFAAKGDPVTLPKGCARFASL
jgi:hypothetical protein